MPAQLSLPLQLGPRVVAPDSRRAEPTIWVRRLWVLRRLESGDEHVIRRVTLRRGLNVLWAPPSPPSTLATGDNRLFEGRLTGHTAGKTTFCRLIRHLLGEPTFGTSSLRERIRAKIPHGWVVGEVILGGELWTVGRPFAIGAHPFAVQGLPIEIALEQRGRGSLEPFLAALETAAIWPLPVRRLPASDQALHWEHVLPWLARDQEARFARFIDWRDSASESESPKLTVDDRHVVVRALLDLISDEERAEQKRNADLVSEQHALEENAPLWAHQVEVDRGRLAALLGPAKAPAAAGPLFGDEPHTVIAARRAALADAESTADGDAAAHLREAWERAVRDRVSAETRLHEAEARVALPIHPASPGPARCDVPLATALAEGCPLAAAHASEARAAAAPAPRDLAAVRQALAAAEAAEREAHEAWSRAEAQRRDAAARLSKERESLDRAAWLAAQIDEGRLRVEVDAERLAQIDKNLRRSYDRQEALRKRRAAALGQISERFDHVIQALMGRGVTGRIEDDGRHLALRVEEHGDRDSAAIATIKLLAFDLAALTASVEGQGFFPRFLLHDGPREADLDQRIYERLFLYARSLEGRFPGEPSFQYIVTTTAPPPAEMQRAPWLLSPPLDASAPEGRLLGVDL